MVSDNPGISLALSSLSVVFMGNLGLTMIDRFPVQRVLWNKFHCIPIRMMKSCSQWFPVSVPQKTPFYIMRQWTLGSFKLWVFCLFVFWLFSQNILNWKLWKLRNLGHFVLILVFESKLWQLPSLSYQKEIVAERERVTVISFGNSKSWTSLPGIGRASLCSMLLQHLENSHGIS